MSLTNLSQIEVFNDQIIDKVQSAKRRLNLEEVPSAIWYPLLTMWQKLLRLSCQELSEIQHQEDFQKRKQAYRKDWKVLMGYFFNDFDSDCNLTHIKNYYMEFEEIEDDIYEFKSLSERKIRVVLLTTLHKLFNKLNENDFSSYLELATLTVEEELETRPLKSSIELSCRQKMWVLFLCGEDLAKDHLASLLNKYGLPFNNIDSVSKHSTVHNDYKLIRNNQLSDNERKRAEKDLEAVINYLKSTGKENALKKANDLILLLK